MAVTNFSNKHPYALAFGSIPAAMALAYLPHSISFKFSTTRVDPLDPRFTLDNAPANSLTRRLRNVHLNGLEAFPIFAAAVLLAHSARVSPQVVDKAALSWLIFRSFFVLAYAAGTPERPWAGKVRSACFVAASGTSIYLMIKAFNALQTPLIVDLYVRQRLFVRCYGPQRSYKLRGDRRQVPWSRRENGFLDLQRAKPCGVLRHVF